MQASGEITGASALVQFLDSLTGAGRAMVSTQPLSEGDEAASPLLQRLDTAAREELGLAAPAYSSATALWALRLFYQLCQFTVCRDVSANTIARICATPCPEPRRPETDWSADLVFRHLPRLFQLAKHLSQADPLLDQLRRLAIAWPLSSVGVPDLKSVDLESFIAHPVLRRLYLDRILATDDAQRLGDPRVDDALRMDLGLHHELAPAAVAAKLFGTGNDTH